MDSFILNDQRVTPATRLKTCAAHTYSKTEDDTYRCGSTETMNSSIKREAGEQQKELKPVRKG